MQKWFRASALAFAIAVMAGCTGNMVYDKYEHTLVSGWEKNDTITFRVPKAKVAGDHQATLMLRTNDSYPFMSLTLVVEQKVSPSETIYTDTLKCTLTDEHGNNKGQGVSYHQFTFPIRTLPLLVGDSLTIRVRHNMKREILPGVSDVGYSLLLH